MAIRPPINQEAIAKLNERGDKLISRAYLLWLFGVGVGLIKLKANKISFSGIEYTVENPEALQGLIFIACILSYIAMIGILIIYSLQWNSLNRTFPRRMIYLASRPRHTLVGLSRKQIIFVKRVARALLSCALVCGSTIIFLPLIHIALFERNSVWLAIKTIISLQ